MCTFNFTVTGLFTNRRYCNLAVNRITVTEPSIQLKNGELVGRCQTCQNPSAKIREQVSRRTAEGLPRRLWRGSWQATPPRQRPD